MVLLNHESHLDIQNNLNQSYLYILLIKIMKTLSVTDVDGTSSVKEGESKTTQSSKNLTTAKCIEEA